MASNSSTGSLSSRSKWGRNRGRKKLSPSEQFKRNVTMKLNKISIINFKRISVELIVMYNDKVNDTSDLTLWIETIFDKTIKEFYPIHQHYGVLFAKLFHQFAVQNKTFDDNTTFNTILLKICQQKYNSTTCKIEEENHRKLLIFTLKFIATLYIYKLLPNTIIIAFLDDLMGNRSLPKENNIGLICTVLSIANDKQITINNESAEPNIIKKGWIGINEKYDSYGRFIASEMEFKDDNKLYIQKREFDTSSFYNIFDLKQFNKILALNCENDNKFTCIINKSGIDTDSNLLNLSDNAAGFRLTGTDSGCDRRDFICQTLKDAMDWIQQIQNRLNMMGKQFQIKLDIVNKDLIRYYKKLMTVEIYIANQQRNNDEYLKIGDYSLRTSMLIRNLVSNEMRKEYIYKPLVSGIIRNIENKFVGLVIGNDIHQLIWQYLLIY